MDWKLISYIVGGVVLVLVLILGVIWWTMPNEPAKKMETVNKSLQSAEDPMAELQKLMNESNRPKPAWRVYLENYGPFGVGIGVFLGLVVVVLKLMGRQRDRDEEVGEIEEAEPARQQESTPSGAAGFFTIGNVVMALTLAIALLAITLSWSGRNNDSAIRKDVEAVKKSLDTKADAESVQEALDKKAGVNYVGQIRTDVNTHQTAIEALNSNHGVLASHVAGAEAKVRKLGSRVDDLVKNDISGLKREMKKVTGSVEVVETNLDSLARHVAQRDSITAAQLDSLRDWIDSMRVVYKVK